MASKIKVLVTGVFDILHQEHINFLTAAKQQGSELWVGVESDVRVKRLKGKDRPINSQAQRVKQLQDLHLAEQVFVLPEQFDLPADHEKLIVELKPAILAVSAHTPHLEEKRRLMKKYGGELRIVRPHNPSISTTILLNQRS